MAAFMVSGNSTIAYKYDCLCWVLFNAKWTHFQLYHHENKSQ